MQTTDRDKMQVLVRAISKNLQQTVDMKDIK